MTTLSMESRYCFTQFGVYVVDNSCRITKLNQALAIEKETTYPGRLCYGMSSVCSDDSGNLYILVAPDTDFNAKIVKFNRILTQLLNGTSIRRRAALLFNCRECQWSRASLRCDRYLSMDTARRRFYHCAGIRQGVQSNLPNDLFRFRAILQSVTSHDTTIASWQAMAGPVKRFIITMQHSMSQESTVPAIHSPFLFPMTIKRRIVFKSASKTFSSAPIRITMAGRQSFTSSTVTMRLSPDVFILKWSWTIQCPAAVFTATTTGTCTF